MIRKATPNDIVFIVNLENNVFTQTLGENFLYDELMLNPFSHYFVIEEQNQLIGYIGFRAFDENSEMMNFAIDPKYHHQGYGSKLLSFSLEHLKSLGVKTLVLEVRMSNKNAQKLYEKFGFTQSHIRKNYYEKEDAIVYIKEV
ncbi:MAG: ribosomal protein S18-alanine N-acetyltransferase [Tenericutes bacterium]|jgi:[ribosomal protein S18]-alanine N-acetyltransferase|nr:ribosomal protein S18-alanine N-acetyltransferase [Mycoplasmatota bacterium]